MQTHPMTGDFDNEVTGSVYTLNNAKLIWAYTKPHLSIVIFGVLIGFVVTASELISPMVTKAILDALEAGTSLSEPLLWLVGVLIIGLIAGFIQTYMFGRLAINVVRDASMGLIQRFVRAPLQQVQQYQTGELVTRVVSDTQLLREATTSTISTAVNGVISLIGTVVLMGTLDLVLLGISLLFLVVVGGSFALIMPKISKAQRDAQAATGKLGGMLESRMRAIRTVKASGAEQRAIDQVNESVDKTAEAENRGLWWSAIEMPIAGGAMQLAIIVILAVGAWRVSQGALTVSALVAFLLYAFNLAAPISLLTMAFTEFQSGLAAAHRINETSHLTPEDLGTSETQVAALADTHARTEDVPVLALDQVRVRYDGGDSNVLDGVSLTIPQCGHIAIVGPSGAGKTTVFSLILRFFEPDSGELLLYGVPYSQLSLAQVRAAMAYVEQETPVVSGTVKDNVLFRVPDATDDEAWQALERVRLADKIRSLPDGLSTEVSSTNLSGGERQRLAVARALVRTPAVLLLDEATAQLDALTEAAIQEVITQTAKTGAVVTIAHRLSTVLDADQIIVLDAGRIRAQGTHTELLSADPLYREFVQALRIEGGSKSGE